MNGRVRIFSILAIAAGSIFSSLNIAYAQYSRADSLKFSSYHQKCKEANRSDKKILEMSDTLAEYARNIGYEKGVTFALFYKERYYRNIHNTDSVVAWTERIKAHTLKTKEKNHYFLVWRNLASYYVDEKYYALALKEIEQMPEVARKMNYIQGVIESYRMLSYLYYSRGIYEKAIESMEKAISMDYEYKIKDFNIFYKYYLLTLSYIETKNYEKAEECLIMGLEKCVTNEMRSDIYRGFLKLYIEKGDAKNAKSIIDSLHLPKYEPEERYIDILSLEAQYYYLTKDYRKAINCYQTIRKVNKPSADYLIREAKCLQKLGRFEEASDILMAAYNLQDSLQLNDAKNEVYEQLALIELDSVNADRDKLSAKLKNARMRYLTIGFIVLVFILAVFIFLTIKYFKLYRKLIKSEGARTSFLNHISHEIRTPLNSIVGFSHILLEDDLSKEEREKCADTISESSDHLLKIISSATEMTDVDNLGRAEECNVNDLCKSVIEQYKNKAQKGVVLSLIPSEADSSIVFNWLKVAKIVSNLVDNSVKYTSEGSITIQPVITEKSLTITVTDTGIGIPQDKQEEVFDYFVTLNQYGQGLGLGLTISRQIVKSLNGTLTIDPKHAPGCKMVMTIPL